MARQEKEIVTTTKIQAVIKGKKRTLRMWRLPIPIPVIMSKHLMTYFDDAVNETLCSLRTPEGWVKYIKSFKMPRSLRGWVTAVIWWHYGEGGHCLLYDYYRSFDGMNHTLGDKLKLHEQLDKMGIGRVANELAAEREARRNVKLNKILKMYEKGEGNE